MVQVSTRHQLLKTSLRSNPRPSSTGDFFLNEIYSKKRQIILLIAPTVRPKLYRQDLSQRKQSKGKLTPTQSTGGNQKYKYDLLRINRSNSLMDLTLPNKIIQFLSKYHSICRLIPGKELTREVNVTHGARSRARTSQRYSYTTKQHC